MSSLKFWIYFSLCSYAYVFSYLLLFRHQKEEALNFHIIKSEEVNGLEKVNCWQNDKDLLNMLLLANNSHE